MLNITQHRNYFFAASIFFMVVSIVFLSMWGLKLSIDFTGGSLLEIKFLKDRPTIDSAQEALRGLNLGEIIIQPAGDKSMVFRFQSVEESTHQNILSALKDKFGLPAQAGADFQEDRFEAIGPAIGAELRTKAVYSIFAVLLAIILYVAWAFRKVSFVVQSWKYGVTALIALAHDVIIPLGLFAALGHFLNVEVGGAFVAAMLTILGFSVHDTIVVFDRMRENLFKYRDTLEVITNRSVNETMARSITTSLTAILALLGVYFFGGESVKYLSLVLIVGIFFGTYSSIFIASPLLVVWDKWGTRKD